jgi:hypothetical protein
LLSTVYCLLTTAPVLAHDASIFEFAPDAWDSKRLDTSTVAGTMYQVFEAPTNASLSGVDLWLDNPGSAGAITLTLFDNSMNQRGVVEVTLPHINTVAGGTKTHFDFPGSIPIQAGAIYNLQISSSLNLGIYYADRILFLEHNKLFTSQFLNGAARIGSEIQEFTFKYALHAPSILSGYNSDPNGVQASSTTPTPTPQQVAITNARIVTSTPSTVTVAWTTNIATDSRVAVRTQLNPLYVIAQNSDQTLELEHTVIVSGLQPSINYFADTYSSQGTNLVLTTYTIAFRTPAGTIAQPTSTPPTTPPTNPPTTPPANPPSNPPSSPPTGSSTGNSSSTTNSSSTPTGSSTSTSNSTSTPNNSQNPSSTQNSGQTGSTSEGNNTGGTSGNTGGGNSNPPPVSVEEGQRNNTTEIHWNGGGGSAYRIDVFDNHYDLERSIEVPAGANSKEIAGLLSGTHHVVVYEKKADGTFVKVGPSQDFVVTRNSIGLRVIIGVSALIFIAGIATFTLLRFKREKIILPPEEGYNPETF